MTIKRNDVVAQSWSHLIELLYIDSWYPDMRKYRLHCAFRGLSNSQYDLTTSLERLGENSHNMERHLIRNFQKYAQAQVSPTHRNSIWEWLTIGQHYGLPTRLLDWTFSPFVALHFATAGIDKRHLEEDAIIWRVDIDECNKYLPQKLRSILSGEGSIVFTVEMMEKAARTLIQFRKLTKRKFVVFLEPPSVDDRIINQFALFSVMSDPRISLNEWLTGHPNSYQRIVIPKDRKLEIRDKLDQANITERMLFPGLEGLAKWLARHYTPRSKEFQHRDSWI